MPEIDPLVSTDEEVEVDAETAAAIDRGLREAKEGKLISADEVRKLLAKWKERFSPPQQQ
jgi:predicted transcriptional regulator